MTTHQNKLSNRIKNIFILKNTYLILIGFSVFIMVMAGLYLGSGKWPLSGLVVAKNLILKLIYASDINTFDPTYLGYMIIGALISVIIEMVFVGYKNSSLRVWIEAKEMSTRIDLYVWLLMLFNIWKLFTIIITFGIFLKLSYFLQSKYNFDLVLNVPSPLLQFLIVFVLIDLKNYFYHWISHRYDFFWEIHRYHHSATNLNFLTAKRTHILFQPLNGFFTIPILIVFGSPIDEIFYINFIREIHQYYQHSQFDWKWGFIGRYILVSPAVHRTHHSLDPKYYGKNLAGNFIFWDRLFGTYVAPPEKCTHPFGVEDDDINNKSFFHGMSHTLVRALKTIRVKQKGDSLSTGQLQK